MDRSWIYGTQSIPAYTKGVEEFMTFVSERYPEDSHILCPCRKCLNQSMQPQHEVSDHIHIFGMSATYTRWIHHGESADAVVVENVVMTLGYIGKCMMMTMMRITEYRS